MDFVYLTAIYISLLVCFLNYGKLDPPYLNYFLWFLLFTALLETAGFYMARRGMINHWLYNLFTLVEVSFLSFIYYNAIHYVVVKKAIRLFSYVYLVLFIINALFIQEWNTFNTYTFVVGGLGVLTWIGIYFIQLMQHPRFPELNKQPLFWISTGLLFYYTGKTPFYGMVNYLIDNHLEVAKRYFVIVQLLIVVEHCLLGVGFLCRESNHK